MGEEWGAPEPFCFFTDFHGELADAVREGRRRSSRSFPEFSDQRCEKIPDPNEVPPPTLQAGLVGAGPSSMPLAGAECGADRASAMRIVPLLSRIGRGRAAEVRY